jgi:hypothetical protein
MQVRRYKEAHNEDMGDVRLDEQMSKRTEYVGKGREQAKSIKHRNTHHRRGRKRRGHKNTRRK